MRIPGNLASNLTALHFTTGWIARIRGHVAVGVSLLLFVGCQPPNNRSADPHGITQSQLDSSCEREVCRLGEWSVRYFPMGQRFYDNDPASTKALSKFQQAQPVTIEGLFVAIVASTDVLEAGEHTSLPETVEQRDVAFDLLIEGGRREKTGLPRGMQNPIIIGDYTLDMDQLVRVDWKLRKMLDDDSTEPRTSARLIGMGIDSNYRAIMFCVQDDDEMSEVNRISFSHCIDVAAKI